MPNKKAIILLNFIFLTYMSNQNFPYSFIVIDHYIFVEKIWLNLVFKSYIQEEYTE